MSTVTIWLIPDDAKHVNSVLRDETFAIILVTEGERQWEIKAVDTGVPRDVPPDKFAEEIAALAGATYRRPPNPLQFIYADGRWTARLAPPSLLRDEPDDSRVPGADDIEQVPLVIRSPARAGSRS